MNETVETNTKGRARLAAAIALLACLPSPVAAQIVSTADRVCISAINKGTRDTALAEAKATRGCVRDLRRGMLHGQTVAQCVAESQKVRLSTYKALMVADQACAGAPPSFGPASTSAHPALVLERGVELLHDLFGSDPDGAISGDAAVGRCQEALLGASKKCKDTRIREFNKCKKAGLKRGFVTNGDQLRDICLGEGALQPDPTGGKITKACVDSARTQIESKCVGAGVVLADAFPGCEASSGAALAGCLDDRIRCRACNLLNVVDGLTRDCDAFDDGNDANGSCPEPTVCGDGSVDGAETCDDGAGVAGDGCGGTCQTEIGWTCTGAPSSCDTICGDGLIRGDEACDDGNADAGDGCDDGCEVEPGYTCDGTPSQCATTCGDGVVAGDEVCDDDNTSSGDGCNATCKLENGWGCAGNPSVCTPICGDGVIKATERCDDAGTTAGDGCDAACQIEAGWACTGQPSHCGPICGDGLVRGGEACDDHGTASRDGCSSTCQIETGWSCVGEPSACTADCGDGIIRGSESCDDGGTASDDGCSAACQIENGWACLGQPSACAPVCGDGLVRGDESCDDGARTANDGCDNNCQVEPGWTCGGQPTTCAPVCGDGLVRGSETCDDEGTAAGDGCGATCQTENGWRCTGEPSECAPICGDQLIRGGEQCDDGDAALGDGCGITCRVEPGYVCSGQPSSCVRFRVTITSPANGIFTQAGSIAVTGVVTNLAPASASLTVNGVAVTVAPNGTFSATVTLNASKIFNPIRATVTDLAHGSSAHDRVVVIVGQSVADGALSAQSIGMRFTDSGLDKVEPLVTTLAGSGLDLADLVPVGTVLVNNECFVDGGILGCLGRATVTVANPPASFASFGLAADSKPNMVAANITVSDIRVNVYLSGSGLVPSCDIAIHADAAYFNGNYALEPDAVDASYIDVAQVGNLAVDFTGFTTSYGGTCDLPIVGDIIQAFLPDLEAMTIDAMANYMKDPDGAGPQDGPIAAAIESALDGISITGPVGQGLGVMFQSPLFEVAEDNNGITFGSDSRFTMSAGSGPGQCQPPPGAPSLTASLAFSETFPTFGTTTPVGHLPYELAIAISPEGFNQLLKSQTECGLLVQSITSLDLGSGPVPLTAGVLQLLVPEFAVFPSDTPFRIDIRPTIAPIVTGAPGPNGELTVLKIAQLLLSIVKNDVSQTLVLQGSVDAGIGMNLLFAGGGLGFELNAPAPSEITVAVLDNPLGVNEAALETTVLPPLIAQMLPSLAGSLASFPLPSFLGLTLQGVEVSRIGEFLAIWVTLCTSNCQAPTCTDHVRNGTETDVDCGGSCPACARGRTCEVNGDCLVNLCSGGICGCPTQTFTFSVGANNDVIGSGDGDLSDEWLGGSQTQGGAVCNVTVAKPSGNIDLAGTLGNDWEVTSSNGYSSCFGSGGEDGDGCQTPSCDAPAAVGSCQARRPSCSSGLGGGGSTATFTVQCAN